jgi:uncharacterized membrane protein
MLSRINLVQCKIVLGFVFAAIVFVAFSGTFNMNHYAMLVALHALAGIVWIGLLYYFNFVQVPAMGAALADEGGPGPAAIGKYVAPRALLWFRMAAATTWILGIILLLVIGMKAGTGAGALIGAFTFSLAGTPGMEIIGIGAWMGTIMAFNVWFIIWPNQQKVLGLKEATDEAKAKAKTAAAYASSINVILSIPMLLSMIAYR